MHKPEWWDAFLAEYESRWGDMPKASEEANQPAFLDVWFRELEGMRPDLVTSLCQRVQAEMGEIRWKGKPRLAQFTGQLRIILEPWKTAGKHNEETDSEQVLRTPLFDVRQDPPRRLREPFLIELPATVQKELWRIQRDAVAPNVDHEAVHAAISVLFGAGWEDYTEEERHDIKRFGGHAVKPPKRTMA